MALNPRSYGLAQIQYLVASINRKNYKGNTSEITTLVEKHGVEAEKHLFRCLLSQVDFSSNGSDGRTNAGKDGQQLQLLIQESSQLITRRNFVSILCHGFENQDNKTLRPVNQMISIVSKSLKLSRVHEVVFALGLSESVDPDIKTHAMNHLKSKLPDLIRSYSDMSSGFEGGLGDIAVEVLHLLLSYLLQCSEDETGGISPDTVEGFVQVLRRDFPRERVPVVLAPLLYREQQDITEDRLIPVSVTLPLSVSSIELAEIIRDVGYAATASKQDMLEILKDFGKANITPAVVARVLGMMAQTHSDLSDSLPYMGVNSDPSRMQVKSPSCWDAKVLATALQALVPNLCWRDVVPEMDYEGFYIPSTEGLNLIMTCFNVGSKDSFPIEMIYEPWLHTKGQLSWFQQALSSGSSFNFYNYPFNPVNLEPLKNSYLGEEAKTWRSLSLIETLLNLAEQGHHSEVIELFRTPVKHCPEVFFLGLLQCKTSWQVVETELLSHLLPHFINNHPSSSSVLSYVWHSSLGTPAVHALLIKVISDWYSQNDYADHTRILKILDICQDLKMLPVILKCNHFPFVIDLATWAAKRKFLKLDLWMMEKIKEVQDQFVQECIQFLVYHAPRPIASGGDQTTGLTHDIVITMLACLQPYVTSLKPEYAQKLKMLINYHGPISSLPPRNAHPLSLGMDIGNSGVVGGGVGSDFPGSPSSTGVKGTPQSFGPQGPFGQDILSSPLGVGGAVGGSGNSFGGGKMPGGYGQPSQQVPDPVYFSVEQPSKDVDERANAFFQAIYNSRMSVNQLLEILKQFKDSANKKEKDLFVCMLRNIFEEYKFFPQFPEKELRITGQLFGGIVEHGLVTYMSLNLALRFILEALKKPPSSKMHLFGLAALDKCKKRLKDFPQFCVSIAGLSHFQSFPSQLKQCVQYGQQSMDPPPSSIIGGQLQGYGGIGHDTLGPIGSVSGNPIGSIGSAIGAPVGGPGSLDLATPTTLPSLPSVATTSIYQPGPGSGSSPLPSPVGGPEMGQFSPVATTSSLPSTSLGGGGGGGGGGGMVGSLNKTPVAAGNSPITKPGTHQPPSINNTSIDTLLVAADLSSDKKPPSQDLQDKVHFLFNNLSSSTLQQKVEEFISLVSDEYYDWVAQYLVMKRTSIEPNYHPLYMNFIDAVNHSKLRKAALKETYRNIKVILSSDKTSNNFSDRAILKNLGKWLGMQTLAKNKPILHIDLAVKDLVLEAYHRGQQDLLYVVPFVAKVLEACADSKIFKPPNPWVMAIMSVLGELHAVPDLKLNLKFEVEVLCKHLSLEISELPPSNFLSDTDRAKKLCQLVSQKDKQSGAGTSPPQPLYPYEDIPTTIQGIAPLIQISPQIALLQQYPQLKQYVKSSIEKSIQDLLVPVADRSAKIALTTAEHIIKKDFALDPEVSRMHAAAVHMVRHLTAGMAMITCREPLLLSICNNLKSAFSSVLRHPVSNDEQLKQLIEQAALQLSADNTELASAFIQKTAVEKVVPEMEKRLTEEFELRQLARSERRQYYNHVVLSYQVDKMPEQLRVNVGGPTPQQAVVYEEFARCLPGFLPSSKDSLSKGDPASQFVPTEEFVHILSNCIKEITNQIRMIPPTQPTPHVIMMRSLLEMAIPLRINPTYANVITLLQKALEGLLEGMNPPPSDPDMFVSFRDSHILILRALQDQRALGPRSACRLVTKMLMEAREDIKYSPRALILLIGLQLVDMKQLDEFLAKAVESGRNLVALSCSIKLVNAIDSAASRETPITDNDLKKTKDTLLRLALNVRQLPESTAQLLEPFCLDNEGRIASLNSEMGGSAPGMHSSMMHHTTTGGATGPSTTGLSGVPGTTGELEDPPGLYEKVEYLLSEWVRHFHQPGLLRDGDKIYAAYVARQQGILKNDDLIQRFFRISMEMCVELCYRTLNDPVNGGMSRPKCYHTMDAFVKLVVVLVRYSGEPSNTLAKVNLLNKVLLTVTQVLLQDHEKRQVDFHQLPYHRFFIMILNDLCSPDPVFDAISFPVLQCFCTAYHMVRPSKAPGFAYSWLELISHRVFVSKLLLQTPQQKGWPLFHQLLIDLFKFLSPFLRNSELVKPTQTLYKGTLRVLLVLLHDFPEFLCDYHFSFCDVIPPNCIQMRNLILSAFPRNMRLPDPFTPNLKVELLPDIQNAPRILPTYIQLIPPELKKNLDNYIKTRAPVTFLQELRGHLQISTEPGKQYNSSLINALVLYVGTQAIAFIHSKSGTPSPTTIAHTAHMDIFQHLVVDLDTEGRYLFLNAIANQLRYPNSHTHFFSCALLSLFSETNHEAIQEQITRVLLERLIVNRPHPWGLLITFIDLIKNPTYNFWKHDFVHCAPEIEKLFESVAKSCMQKQPTTSSSATSTSTSTRESTTDSSQQD